LQSRLQVHQILVNLDPDAALAGEWLDVVRGLFRGDSDHSRVPTRPEAAGGVRGSGRSETLDYARRGIDTPRYVPRGRRTANAVSV